MATAQKKELQYLSAKDWDARKCMGLVQLDRILDCLDVQRVFGFENNQGVQFNFKAYYDDYTKFDFDPFISRVFKKLESVLLL